MNTWKDISNVVVSVYGSIGVEGPEADAPVILTRQQLLSATAISSLQQQVAEDLVIKVLNQILRVQAVHVLAQQESVIVAARRDAT